MGRKRKTPNASPVTSIRQKAYQHIQRKVVTGELSAGQIISELDLAKELGSSRTPIREAISQLIAEGLLEQSPGGSVLVVHFTREDIVDLCELREALETYSLTKAAKLGLMRLADKERLQKLIDAIAELRDELATSGEATLNEEQMKRFIAVDFSFHAILISLSHNIRINKIVNDTRLLMRIFSMLRHGHTAADLERIHQRHQELIGHLEHREVEATAKTISEYLQESQRERLDEFDQHQREESIRESMPAFMEELYQSLAL
jgi:DNA-binding GntR family transcriptional regulator